MVTLWGHFSFCCAPEVFAISRLEVATEHNVSSSQLSEVMHIKFTSRLTLKKMRFLRGELQEGTSLSERCAHRLTRETGAEEL